MGINKESLQVVIDRSESGKMTNAIILRYILTCSACGVCNYYNTISYICDSMSKR